MHTPTYIGVTGHETDVHTPTYTGVTRHETDMHTPTYTGVTGHETDMHTPTYTGVTGHPGVIPMSTVVTAKQACCTVHQSSFIACALDVVQPDGGVCTGLAIAGIPVSSHRRPARGGTNNTIGGTVAECFKQGTRDRNVLGSNLN